MVEYAYKENGVLKLKPVAMSLSQAQIDEITTELLEAMQPDWQNAISLTAAQLYAGYAAPDNGLFVCSGVYTNRQQVIVTINGIEIARSGYTNDSDYNANYCNCIVNKGDVIKLNINAANKNTIAFVPFKTSNPVSLRPIDKTKIDAAIVQHWDDITSDFSTAGSTAGFVLDRAAYNPILRKLRVNFHITNSFAAGTAKYFIITYNGSDLPAFTRSCFYRSCKIESDTYNSGFEDSYVIQQSNKLNINMFNRNVNASWAANTTSFTTQIEF